MKKICKFVGLLGALALGTTIASAASAADSIHANVPFSFVLAGKVFPAGKYTVTQTDTGVIVVQGQGTAAIALSVPADVMNARVPGLRFTNNNGHEYLVSVESYSSARTVPVPETRTLALSH